ncbi:hypothetical protein DM02DRAFT_322374 [Periconia macrospinosa]|uniref:Transmembrane protein n=1 Tax=Periconia macrospinosa TaxID=97972 RepID=A0A2V1E9W1_9PLEO|nr:hypothetical protein DM02DRAFT_322374 [Periconia macrospinosa]
MAKSENGERWRGSLEAMVFYVEEGCSRRCNLKKIVVLILPLFLFLFLFEDWTIICTCKWVDVRVYPAQSLPFVFCSPQEQCSMPTSIASEHTMFHTRTPFN